MKGAGDLGDGVQSCPPFFFYLYKKMVAMAARFVQWNFFDEKIVPGNLYFAAYARQMLGEIGYIVIGWDRHSQVNTLQCNPCST